jgi:hypothetical protein
MVKPYSACPLAALQPELAVWCYHSLCARYNCIQLYLFAMAALLAADGNSQKLTWVPYCWRHVVPSVLASSLLKSSFAGSRMAVKAMLSGRMQAGPGGVADGFC